MIERAFTAHPRSVGETYFEHMRTANGFGGAMIVAGIACLIHGLIPGLFRQSGSRTIERLHNQMVVNRRRQRADQD